MRLVIEKYGLTSFVFAILLYPIFYAFDYGVVLLTHWTDFMGVEMTPQYSMFWLSYMVLISLATKICVESLMTNFIKHMEVAKKVAQKHKNL